ncbi:unknown protein [Seminavis robusta]|uniref:Uncharacterized protein n=1 Tax=Seminavis robusta TaxID=568900 RepID=A0A9N8HTA3_9STRA|nr:unknown protein [Seminavis robusta]|eukprot:Sro1846_g301360.1 n/a (239) ;mRNA; r:9769-11127
MSDTPQDTRKKVGGECWALASQVTHDARRMFGASYKTTWIKGVVQEVEMRKKNEHSKRGTNYVRALYKLDSARAKDVWICLQSLKASNPNKDGEDPIEKAIREFPDRTFRQAFPDANQDTTTPSPPPLTGNSNSNSNSNEEQPRASAAEATTEETATPPPTEGVELDEEITPFVQQEPTSPALLPRIPGPVSENHGYEWYHNKTPTDVPFNGPTPFRAWEMKYQEAREQEAAIEDNSG